MKHKPQKFWLVETFFFIDAKLLSYILTTVNHGCPVFLRGGGGGVVHTQAIRMRRYLMLFFSSILRIISLYYINTNETPGELSHKNLISSHVKITCYLHNVKISPLLWLHNKSRLSHQKTI